MFTHKLVYRFRTALVSAVITRSKGTGKEPVKGPATDPVQKLGKEPVKGTITEPVQKLGKEPVKRTATEPVQKLGKEPVNRTATDPVQKLFLEKIREYRKRSPDDNFVDPSPSILKELESEMSKLDKNYGGGKGVDMTAFPTFKFIDPKLDSIDEVVPEKDKKQKKKKVKKKVVKKGTPPDWLVPKKKKKK